ncbi:hypothetical protein TruAng_006240 [Truncatella angustata]|nr:hypothetical protein TruAng_006240 [Truncatella angustata]
MRTLMLHGHGTSASIFQLQTSAFRSKLDDSFTFHFLDGFYTAPPAPGTDIVFGSKNSQVNNSFTWFATYDLTSVLDAIKKIDEYIQLNGPFDCVCGFSQGCSLAASLLLYSRQEGRCPPFKSAVFICGGVSFEVLENLGLRVPQIARDISKETGRVLQARASVLARLATDLDQIEKGVGLWDDTDGLIYDPTALPALSDCFGLDLTAFSREVMIDIPTVHIYGGRDPRWPSSVQLAYLCDSDKRTTLDHGGGHDIPRLTGVSRDIADTFRKLKAV